MSVIEGVLRDTAGSAAARMTVERAIDPELPQVMGDAERSQLSGESGLNAMKYGASGGWCELAAQAVTARNRQEIAIAVEDHG